MTTCVYIAIDTEFDIGEAFADPEIRQPAVPASVERDPCVST